MMTTTNNYLVLNFQNAKLFRKFNTEHVNRKSGDFVFDGINSYKSRNFYPAFIEPITVHQISNMLHVLFNERPVPSLRTVLYEKNKYYFEKAQNSFLKIDTLVMEHDYGNKKVNKVKYDYYYETTHVKKAVRNSWNPSVSINWEIIRRYVDDNEKFNIFINKLNELLNIDSESIPFYIIRNRVIALSVEKRLDLYETIKNLVGVEGIIYYFGRHTKGKFDKPDNSKLTCKINKTAKMVNTGLESAILLSGQILVPVSDDDILKLQTVSKGFATILDDGLVYIKSIQHENNLSVNGFTMVKDISDAKTTPFKIE